MCFKFVTQIVFQMIVVSALGKTLLENNPSDKSHAFYGSDEEGRTTYWTTVGPTDADYKRRNDYEYTKEYFKPIG